MVWFVITRAAGHGKSHSSSCPSPGAMWQWGGPWGHGPAPALCEFPPVQLWAPRLGQVPAQKAFPAAAPLHLLGGCHSTNTSMGRAQIPEEQEPDENNWGLFLPVPELLLCLCISPLWFRCLCLVSEHLGHSGACAGVGLQPDKKAAFTFQFWDPQQTKPPSPERPRAVPTGPNSILGFKT